MRLESYGAVLITDVNIEPSVCYLTRAVGLLASVCRPGRVLHAVGVVGVVMVMVGVSVAVCVGICVLTVVLVAVCEPVGVNNGRVAVVWAVVAAVVLRRMVVGVDRSVLVIVRETRGGIQIVVVIMYVIMCVIMRVIMRVIVRVIMRVVMRVIMRVRMRVIARSLTVIIRITGTIPLNVRVRMSMGAVRRGMLEVRAALVAVRWRVSDDVPRRQVDHRACQRNGEGECICHPTQVVFKVRWRQLLLACNIHRRAVRCDCVQIHLPDMQQTQANVARTVSSTINI